jgi:mono/diheme cytochrome c family protein
LSTLAQRNQGSFPRDQVRADIVGTGRSVTAHGTTDMPVWGPIFQALEPEGRARERIENLLTHLQSLQRPSTGANDPGAQAFKTYCATCHGATGRGGGPVAAQLRHVPPDLTTFSRRNGGVFPSARLARIIDGRDVQSHGDREMPVWGDAFRVTSGGMSPAQIDDRIAAILRYLESIQERPAE